MSRLIRYDDAIERLGAHLMANAQIDWGGTASTDIEEWKELADMILNGVPTVDAVSVVHGEWILLEPRYPIEQKVYWSKEQAIADTKGNGARERRKCSCCGYTKSFMCHMKDEQIKLWNFCPNCGCAMTKEQL